MNQVAVSKRDVLAVEIKEKAERMVSNNAMTSDQLESIFNQIGLVLDKTINITKCSPEKHSKDDVSGIPFRA